MNERAEGAAMDELMEGSDELLVTDSAAPFARAGFANLLWLIGLAAEGFVAGVAGDVGLAAQWRIIAGVAIFAMILRAYSRSFGRLKVATDYMEFACAIHTVRVDFANIKCVRLGQMGSSGMGRVAIRMKGELLSKAFYYVSLRTNWGDVPQTLSRLRSVLEARRVPVEEPGLLFRSIKPR